MPSCFSTRNLEHYFWKWRLYQKRLQYSFLRYTVKMQSICHCFIIQPQAWQQTIKNIPHTMLKGFFSIFLCPLFGWCRCDISVSQYWNNVVSVGNEARVACRWVNIFLLQRIMWGVKCYFCYWGHLGILAIATGCSWNRMIQLI